MTPERTAQLEEVYMQVAEKISTMSVATRSKVGAIIVKDGNIISMGWNGMPSGFPNEEVEIANLDGTKNTNPLVLHAEANALMKGLRSPGVSTVGATLFSTLSPCVDCCKLIMQAGIKRVVFRDQYRDDSSLKIFARANIETVHLTNNVSSRTCFHK
jgi:dCMP deaminase